MNPKWNVGDAVKISVPDDQRGKRQTHGRIIHIDSKENKNEYGVLYFGTGALLNFRTIQLPENQVEPPRTPNPHSCPSHGITMEYIDELVRKERVSEGTPIKNMQIGGECILTVVFEDGREFTDWSYEERENDTIMIVDGDGTEFLTEEELQELQIDHIVFRDTYTLWSKHGS